MPVRIKAQALRRRRSATAAAPVKHPWREEDVTRAIAAAEQAGLRSYRIDIAPDGVISIIVGTPAETDDPDPYDDLLGPRE